MTQSLVTPAAPASPTVSARKAFGARRSVHLNAFQVLMRHWSKQHPYNAGQVMRVAGEGDARRWKQAVESVIGELGLGQPQFNSSGHCVQYDAGSPVDVQIDQSSQELADYFNEELNRPFPAGDLPIRFCILPSPEHPESHYFAAVYDHWIADSRAMRELMRRIFERYQDPASSRIEPLTLEAPNFYRLFRHHVGWLTRLGAFREGLRNTWRHRHGYRVNLHDPLDYNSRCIIRHLPEGLIDRLYQFAKIRAASVNDLFITVIAQTMGSHTGDRIGRSKKPFHFRREQVGVGTIVDIRDAACEPLDRVFNLYLSSYTVLLDKPENRPTDQLMRQVSLRTKGIKQNNGTVKAFLALAVARFWVDVYDSPRFQAQLLHKSVPVVAGISNVKMAGDWVQPTDAQAPHVEDYLRISPTGPLIPLVFTLTTIANRLSLCVTYRTTSFSQSQVESILQDFQKRLESIHP